MKILTVISNYNEEKAILNTIEDIHTNCTVDTDILIIDNCSSDLSQKLIKSTGLDYIFHPVNTGGSAGVIKTALVYSFYNDYDIYCHMDGDNQHCASELYKIIETLKKDESDIVIGSRFLERKGFQSHFLRRVGIRLFSYILTKITKNQLTDITSGFRAYNRKAIEYFTLKYKHEFEACLQMLLVASFADLKISEVPVIMRPRATGKSEINTINALKFPIFGTISLIGTLLQKH